MAIKLQSLYKAINNQFDVILHTNSFYDKEVTWIHTVEQGEFSHLLHGDELIFNSGLNFTSQDWLAMKYSFRCSPLPGTLRSLISCGSFLRFC